MHFLLCSFLTFFIGQVFASPYNYVYFARDRERINETAFLKTKNLIGAQLLYAWKELETKEGVYDFSEIEKDLAYLKAHQKRLFIQIQDTSFSPHRTAVPRYLQTDALLGGGVVPQFDEEMKPAGWVMRRWDSNVAQRFHLF